MRRCTLQSRCSIWLPLPCGRSDWSQSHTSGAASANSGVNALMSLSMSGDGALARPLDSAPAEPDTRRFVRLN